MKTLIRKISLAVILACSFHSAASQWVQTSTPPGGAVYGLKSTTFYILSAGTGASAGMYKSVNTNMGDIWTQTMNPAPNVRCMAVEVSNGNIYVGTTDGEVFKSTNTGTSWTDVTPTGSSSPINQIALSSTHIFIGTDDNSSPVMRAPLSNVSSGNWSSFSAYLPNTIVRSIAVNGSKVYAGTYGQGVWISSTSTDSFASTSGMAPSSDYISSIVISGNMAYAGNISGTPVLYYSTDTGNTWDSISSLPFNSQPVYALLQVGPVIWVGTEGAGVLSSVDSGDTWVAYNSGLASMPYVVSLHHYNDTLFAGTYGGVYKIGMPAGLPLPPPCNFAITTQPQATFTTATGTNAQFTVSVNQANSLYQWQTNPSNVGWQNILSNATYSGVNDSTLQVSNVQLSNHQQPFRAIVHGGLCDFDTTTTSMILISDTCVAIVNDTVPYYDTIPVFDTIPYYDTIPYFDTIPYYDTIPVFDTIPYYDTIPVYDTIHVIVYDTILVFDTIPYYDTIPVFDTIPYYDTIPFYDTIHIIIYDTIRIKVYDTVVVIVYDTILVIDGEMNLFMMHTGINNSQQAATLHIYPNPTSDIIYIDFGQDELMPGFSVSINDATGSNVYLSPVTSQLMSIDISSWAIGTYFLSILDPVGVPVATRKVILQ